jgi:transposase
MDNFAGLDVPMEETHVCVVDRDGAVIHEVNVQTESRRIFVGWHLHHN